MPPTRSLTEILEEVAGRLRTPGVARNTPAQAPITSGSLAPQAPINLPVVPPSSAIPSALGAFQTQAQQSQQQLSAFDQLQQQQDQSVTRAKAKTTPIEQEIQDLQNQIVGVEQSRAAREQEAGIEAKALAVNQARREVANYNNQLIQEQAALQRQIEAIEKNPQGMLASGVQANQEKVQRESLRKQADISLLRLSATAALEGANFDLTTAQSIVDRKIALELEPLQQKLKFQTEAYENIKSELTKAEERQWQLMIKKTDREASTTEENLRGAYGVWQQAAENGAPAAVQQQILQAINRGQYDVARGLAGPYQRDPLDRSAKLQQLENARLQGAKLAQEITANKPLTGEYASVINGAAGLVPNTKRDTVKTNIANALAAGNYVNAYAEIANAVSDGLTGENKTKFDNSRTDVGIMLGMRQAIQQFTDAGGNLGYLKGTADSIAKRFGQLKSDPKFSALATQLEREFQTYRLNMTGAAFSPEESREYAKVNPRGNASLDLNLATIDGALAQLSNRINSTVNARIPDAQRIYDLVEGQSTSGGPVNTAPANTSLMIGPDGRQYYVPLNQVEAFIRAGGRKQ